MVSEATTPGRRGVVASSNHPYFPDALNHVLYGDDKYHAIICATTLLMAPAAGWVSSPDPKSPDKYASPSLRGVAPEAQKYGPHAIHGAE